MYAARTAVLAVVTLLLLARRQWRPLSLLAGVAVVAPLTDAWLTADAGGPTVARHLAIAALVAVTSVALRRTALAAEAGQDGVGPVGDDRVRGGAGGSGRRGGGW